MLNAIRVMAAEGADEVRLLVLIYKLQIVTAAILFFFFVNSRIVFTGRFRNRDYKSPGSSIVRKLGICSRQTFISVLFERCRCPKTEVMVKVKRQEKGIHNDA